MTYVKQIVGEFRDKRLWPVALALMVALIAVPTLLAKSSSPAPIAPRPQPGAGAASPASAVPAVSVETTSQHSNLKGHARDPFGQQQLPVAPANASTPATTATKPSTGSTTTAAGSTSAAIGSGSSAGSGGGSAASGSSSTAGSTAGTPLPRVRFYRFATSLRFGRVGRRLRFIEDVDKFTPLPSASNPVALFLGLRNDARTAVFMLSASASATGKGTCWPNHWSCDFLYLKVGQRELLLTQGVGGRIAQYELDLTRIHPVPTSAPGSAKSARARGSSSGRRALAHRSAVRLVDVGRLASASASAVRAAAGDGAL